MTNEPAVRAVGFESRKIYQSHQRPSYTSWESFFPGESGQWYLTCEEVTRPATPLPRSTPQQWFRLVMPVGYDTSQYLMEAESMGDEELVRQSDEWIEGGSRAMEGGWTWNCGRRSPAFSASL